MLVALILAALGITPTAAADTKATQPRIVVVGDSITGGAGTANPDRFAWPTRLGFERSTTNGGCLVTPNCFGGALPAVATYDTDVLAQAPDVVVIGFGINDITANDVRMRDILDGMVQLAERNRDLGIETYVGTVTPVRGERFEHYDAERRALNRLIRGQFGNHTIDFSRALTGKGGRLRERFDSGDKLHPNARAYRVMAEVAASVLAASGEVAERDSSAR